MDTSTDKTFVRNVIQLLLPDFIEVSHNIFGNFLCQKVIESANAAELRQIINLLLPIATEMALNQHGTRTMQSIVEQAHKFIVEEGLMQDELKEIIKMLEPVTLQLCTDVHGNHVVQTFITKFRATESPEDKDTPGSEKLGQFTDFIFNACMQNPLEIGTHKQGCCVM